MILGTSSQFATLNPILDLGDEGYETDTRRHKVGDGISTWAEIDYGGPYISDVNKIVFDGSGLIIVKTVESDRPKLTIGGYAIPELPTVGRSVVLSFDPFSQSFSWV